MKEQMRFKKIIIIRQGKEGRRTMYTRIWL